MSKWKIIYADKKELLRLKKYVLNEIYEWKFSIDLINKRLKTKYD